MDPISAVLNIGSQLIDRLWPDPTQRDQAKLELLKMQQSGELAKITAETDIAKAQLAVNQAEASNTNWFVAGGRPFVIWTCGLGLAIQFVVSPVGTWIAALAGHPVVFPSLDMGTLMTMLGGLLGLGGMRTFEKLNGVQGKH